MPIIELNAFALVALGAILLVFGVAAFCVFTLVSGASFFMKRVLAMVTIIVIIAAFTAG